MCKKLMILSMLVACCGLTAVEYTAQEQEMLSHSIEFYWKQVNPPEVPRAFDVNVEGCPICGDAMKKHGNYSWIISRDRPYKVQCPECKTIFPDNDFEAYMKSGFKDKSLLTGKYVDDGRGYVPGPGLPKYWFVAYYNHWNLYQDTQYKGTDIIRLADAYTRTGNVEFARRSLAMIDHLAERYSEYNYNKQSRYAELYPWYNGRYLNAIWESIFTNYVADAYLQTRKLLQEEDPELTKVTGKSAAEMRSNMENNLFRVIATDITSLNGKNSGNFGMHQKTLLKVARILNDLSYVKWVTDFRPSTATEDFPLDYAIYSNIFGDGAPIESPGYNTHWISNIVTMFYLIKENGIDNLALHQKSKHIFTYGLKFSVCGDFAVSSGDSGMLNNHTGYAAREDESCKMQYDLYPNAKTAAILLQKYLKPEDEMYAEFKKIADKDYGYTSNILPSYGMASMQNGNREFPTAVTLAFPNYIGHRHADVLDLGFFAEGTPLMPDFGYPNTASGDDPSRMAFYSNTLAHNTVVVNARSQAKGYSQVLRYDTDGFAQRIVASNPGTYGIDKYKRNVIVCETAPGKSIVFDVFRVVGGTQHDWMMHSCGEEFSTDIPLTKQETGTLAGPDVKFGEFYDSPKHKAMTGAQRDFTDYWGSGFQFLANVQKGTVKSGNVITLPAICCKDISMRPGAALKLHMLGDENEIFLSHGEPQITHNNPQKHLVFVTRRHAGSAGLKSDFVTVIESTSKGREQLDIAKVEEIPVGNGCYAAKISLNDGKLLYVFDGEESNPADFSYDGIHFTGEAGALLLDNAGKTGKAYVAGEGSITVGDRILVHSDKAFEATITQVNLEAESIVLDKDIPAMYAGRFFRSREYAYKSDNVQGNVMHLDEQSMIRGRSRFMTLKSENSGVNVPGTPLIRSGQSMYMGDTKAEYVGKVTQAQNGLIVCDNKLEVNKDYWLSECGPGDSIVIPSCAWADFEITW